MTEDKLLAAFQQNMPPLDEHFPPGRPLSATEIAHWFKPGDVTRTALRNALNTLVAAGKVVGLDGETWKQRYAESVTANHRVTRHLSKQTMYYATTERTNEIDKVAYREWHAEAIKRIEEQAREILVTKHRADYDGYVAELSKHLQPPQ